MANKIKEYGAKIKELWSGLTWKVKGMIILGFMLLCSFIYNWYNPKIQPVVNQITVAPPSKVTTGVPTEVKPNVPLKVYNKKILASKAELPKEVLDDEDEEVTAVTTVPPSELSKTEVTTTVNTKTGETTTYTQVKPPAFASFENKKLIGVGYGYTTKGLPEIKLYGAYTFARVESTYVSVQAELNNKAEGKAFVTVDYRW